MGFAADRDLTVVTQNRNHAGVSIPTEPIGSVPRPAELIAGMRGAAEGQVSDDELETLREQALEQTIAEFEATGSP
jgi:5-methyltetrahydropteroyltriglutamate--homocysteine methyltransferase